MNMKKFVLNLRRKVKFKSRKKHITVPTSHRIKHSYNVFCQLYQDTRYSTCKMDTVIEYKRNKINFNEFNNYDIVYINSQVDSRARKSLDGYSSIRLFIKMFGAVDKEFLNLFGIQEIPKEKLDLTYKSFKKEK